MASKAPVVTHTPEQAAVPKAAVRPYEEVTITHPTGKPAQPADAKPRKVDTTSDGLKVSKF